MVNTMLRSDNVHVYQAITNNLHITNEEFWKLLKLQKLNSNSVISSYNFLNILALGELTLCRI